jgi:hypothetical protein
MKKWLFVLAMAIGMVLAGVYVFIPSSIKVQKVTPVAASEKGLSPLLQSPAGLARWWGVAPDSLQFNGNRFTVAGQLFTGSEIMWLLNRDTLSTQLQAVALGKDSCQVAWSTLLPDAGLNPISRIRRYLQGQAIKKDMGVLLGKLQLFAADMANIYGIRVQHTQVQDTLLLALQHEGQGLPNDSLVYQLIQQTQRYAQAQGAKVTNPPMLSIFTEDSVRYKTMVALPISREVPAVTPYSIRRMFAGNILVTEVKGGPATVAEAFRQLDRYRSDHGATSPAKPFQSLVTDRSAEPDSSQWVTRIFWPVF